MNDTPPDIASALDRLKTRLREYETRYDREPHSVALLAVSKQKPLSMIDAAMDAGQQAFGENYLDEALEKMRACTAVGTRRPTWHYIGQIQSRHCKDIAANFDWAQSVDRHKVARRLSEFRCDSERRETPLNVCIQINTDSEESKGGVSYDELDELVDACNALPGLRLRGLMAIPAPRESLDEQRSVFARLAERFRRLQSDIVSVDTLSIGMSNDLEAAIAEGSTMVRVGTAVFGARERAR